MRVEEAISGRRSVREYTGEPVDEPTLRRLVDAAVKAPNAVNDQPWAFTVVRDQALLDRISREAKAHMLETMPPGGPAEHFRARLSDPDFPASGSATIIRPLQRPGLPLARDRITGHDVDVKPASSDAEQASGCALKCLDFDLREPRDLGHNDAAGCCYADPGGADEQHRGEDRHGVRRGLAGVRIAHHARPRGANRGGVGPCRSEGVRMKYKSIDPGGSASISRVLTLTALDFRVWRLPCQLRVKLELIRCSKQ